MTFLLLAGIVILLGTAGVLFQMYRTAVAFSRGAESRQQTERAEYERTFGAIADIEDSLNAIGGDRVLMGLGAEAPEPRYRTVEQRRREALARISDLGSRLQRDQAKIQQLEGSLRQGGVRVAGLERTITALKQSAARAEGMISQLTARLSDMTSQVASLKTELEDSKQTVHAREQTLEAKRRELATVYYIIGTKKELTHEGVVVANGGVLGIGRSLLVSDRLSDSLFTPLDTDRDRVIRIRAARAAVLSSQSAGSYALKPDGERLTLEIIEPGEFRKVKHVIIKTEP